MPNKHLLKRIACFVISLSMCSGLLGALPASAGDASAETVTQTIVASDDLYIHPGTDNDASSGKPKKDTNYNDAAALNFHQNKREVWVRFNLNDYNIPDGYELQSAVCKLYINDIWNGSQPYPLSLYSLSSSVYDATKITFSLEGRPTRGDKLITASFDYPKGTVQQFVEFDLTNVDYLTNALESGGLLAFSFLPDTPNVNGGINSLECGNDSVTPRLVFTFKKKPAPKKITSLTAMWGTEENTVDLEWDADEVADSYEVYMGETSGNTTLMSPQPVITQNGTKMQTTVSVPNSAVQYYFTVTATNDVETSEKSNEACTPGAFDFEKASVADGYDDYNVKNKSIEFVYSNRITLVRDSDIAVTKNGTGFYDYSYDVEENKVIVTFDTLDFGATYNITVSDEIEDQFTQTPLTAADVTFTTMEKSVVSDAPALSAAQNTITATVNVYNPYDTDKSATLVLAVYDENNAMLALESQTLPIGAGDEEPFEVTADNGYCAKAFVVDNLTDMNLLCSQFAVIPGNDVLLSNGTQSLSIGSLAIDGFDLNMQGSVSPAAVKMVLIRMTDENGTLKAVNPMYTDADGSFLYEYVFPSDFQDGTYTMLVSGRNLSNTDSETVVYKNPERELVSLVNSATSAAGVASVIQSRTAVLGLDSAYLNQNGYDILFEQKPFAKIADLKQMLISAKTILDDVNASDWETLSNVIMNNDTILMHGSSNYDYYAGLLTTQQQLINHPLIEISELNGGFSSIKLFRDSFDDAVDKYKEEGNSSENDVVQTIIAVDDLYIHPGTDNDANSGKPKKETNYNNAETLNFHQNNREVWVRFNLNEIEVPDGYELKSAVYKTYITDIWGGTQPHPLSIYSLTSSVYNPAEVTHSLEGRPTRKDKLTTSQLDYPNGVVNDFLEFDLTDIDYWKNAVLNGGHLALSFLPDTSGVNGSIASLEYGDGSYAPRIVITYKKKTAPKPISSLKISKGAAEKTVNLEWVASVDADSYEVYMGDTSENTTLMSPQPTITQNGLKMKTTITVPSYGVPFYFAVTAVNDTGTSEKSNVVSTPETFEFESASVVDGYDDYDVMNKSVTFIYNNEIDTVSASDITVKKNGAGFSGYSFEISDNKLIITFDALEFETPYSISVSDDITDWFGQNPLAESGITFTTMKKGVASTVPVIEKIAALSAEASQEMIKATANVYNPYDTEKSATLVLAVYDENNAMLALESQTLTIGAGDEKPFEVSTDSGYCAKAFVVDNLTDMNLLCPQFAVLSGAESTQEALLNSGIQSLSIGSLAIDGFDLSMQGSVSPAAVKMILIRMTDENGTLKTVNPMYTDADGSFSYGYVFPDALEDGTYTMLVSGRNLSNTDSETVAYKNPERELVSLVNSATSVAGVASVIQTRTTVLGLDSAYLNQNGYDILFEQKPFVQISDLKQMLVSAKTVLDSINASDWSSLGGVILANETILSHGSSGYSYYKNLIETERNKINQPIKTVGNYSTIKLFRSSFDDAVTAYIDDITPPNDPPSGGGGGGGGGKNVSYNVEVKTENETPSNETITGESGFKYPVEVLWAKDSIEYLYKEGIVSGDGNGDYRPLDNITREEFVKLLVEALEIEKNYGECKFSDVSAGAWYTSYLAAAQNAGIVQGTPEGKFGVGQAITRQDIVVMSYRAITALAKELKETQNAVTFADEREISEYAKDAVAAMQKSGIIAGVGDNMFAPIQYANRAQAAKIIHNLILSIKGGI